MGILVELQALIQFFRWMAQNGPFFGPQGAKMEHTLLSARQGGAVQRLRTVSFTHLNSQLLVFVNTFTLEYIAQQI